MSGEPLGDLEVPRGYPDKPFGVLVAPDGTVLAEVLGLKYEPKERQAQK